MPEYKITILESGEKKQILSDGGKTLLELLQGAGSQIHAPCGGSGTCHQCTVTVTGVCRAHDGSERMYTSEKALACRLFPAGDVEVSVTRAGGERILSDAIDIPAGGKGLGLAVDIGTTTVAMYLYDLETGKCLDKMGEMNAQRAFGSDVISRIRRASEPDGLDLLSGAIRRQIEHAARRLCPETEKINYISIAGNTVMEHIFAGLSPESIGVAPFEPLSLFGTELDASELLSGFAPDCRLYICPAVAGYVGGDITAGLLSSGAFESESTVLFVDIGTNGEMGLGGKNGFICCATAAGPAFEGAEMECGSPAQDGAINKVEKDLSFTVLGDTEPKSICGSGIIDAVAALLYNEIVDETGRMDGEKYSFAENVWLTGKDIRQLQLAKAAVRAGVETLLKKTGEKYSDISRVLIAGGFGAYMRTESACAIGLLPPELLGRISHVGNSAGKGASLALTQQGRAQLAAVSGLCRYEELSASPLFNDCYIESMMFSEWEDVLQ